MATVASSQTAAMVLAQLRSRRPRVHCLMNTVVQKFTADGISAVGAHPSMTSSPDEIEDFVANADTLTVNLGTLDAQRRSVIRTAVAVAVSHGKSWIVDPVHCDVSPSRLAFARELIALQPTVVRGNQAEMNVIGVAGKSLGIRTGAVDRLAWRGDRLRVSNGHGLMAVVTGTGCLSGGVIAACLAVEQHPMIAASAALAITGVSAQIAGRHALGPGSFEAAFLDALYNLQPDDLLQHARIDDDTDE